MPSLQYHFNNDTQGWKDALGALSIHTPAHLSFDNIQALNLQALQLLPAFAVILVIDTQVLGTQAFDNHSNNRNNNHSNKNTKHPDELMQLWADEHHFRLSVVTGSGDGKTLSSPKELGAIDQVAVFRYVLIPNRATHITRDKKDAIAHIIDEQITTFFKQKLKPKPDYHFSVNQQGQVDNFDLNNTPKAQQYLDCHIVSVAQMLRKHKLACFDMDSTLIKQEVITELAKVAGVGDKVAAITEAAMRGEMDFAASFGQRVALLRDLPARVIDEIKPLLIPNTGAFVTIAALKAMGYYTVLISGGFDVFAKHIATLLGIDEYHANTLDIDNGKLTGQIISPIIDGKTKAKIVAKIADHRAINLDEVICIGDGANDLPMMAISDLGIAYHAKPIVRARADVAINITGLEGVLYALGYPALQPQP